MRKKKRHRKKRNRAEVPVGRTKSHPQEKVKRRPSAGHDRGGPSRRKRLAKRGQQVQVIRVTARTFRDIQALNRLRRHSRTGT